MNQASPRRLRLCADDYGMSPGVNRAIRDLIARERINATSIMVVGSAAGRDDIKALRDVLGQNPRCQIGLHVTLTAPFNPLTLHFKPLDGGFFPTLSAMLRASLLRQLDREIIGAEITAQLNAFHEKFDRTPDYVDGHQHVQLFPQIRDAFTIAVKAAAPKAWVRQCGRNTPFARRLTAPKPLLLDAFSFAFRRLCKRNNVSFNPGFSGAYTMTRESDYADAMDGFLDGLPDGGLVMCHPGFVDEALERLDNVLGQREREYVFLASDDFPQLLAARSVTLG
jgi:predicted glycoside hydrolase/deacetylase ChbG (UPF0249 family)